MENVYLDKIIEILAAEYNSPDYNNKDDPVDELVYILLAKRTSYRLNNYTYNKLKKRFPDWSMILETDHEEIYRQIESGGLGEEKSKNIKDLIKNVYNKFGDLDIKDKLIKMGKKRTYDYLITLPGIGPKSAYCVMLMSLNYSVQPADTHVIRLFYRLGLIKYDQSNHHQAQKKISKICHDFSWKKNYQLHVNFKAHGEKICKKIHPKCPHCIINDYCTFKNNK